MEYVTFRIGSKRFCVFSMTPVTTKRVISSLRGMKSIEELKDVPDGIDLISRAVSHAIVGSGLTSLIRARVIRNRLIKKGNTSELIKALELILSIIPVEELYAISKVVQSFNTLISKEK